MRLPPDTAQAVRQLADYDWRSAAARETFDRLKDLLRREVLDSQFRGMKQVLQNPDPEAMQRVKDMLGDLNAMLEADARGEHTPEDFERFMDNYGELFPDNPENLEELVDSLVRRMAAADRLLSSLSREQREELANLMAQALDDAGLAVEMSRLSDMLRARRPDMEGGQGEMMMGEEPLGLGDATSALAELADLAELETALSQDYPGARHGRYRRGRRPPGLRPPGGGRRRGAAPRRTRAGGTGLPEPQRRPPRADPAGRAAAGRDRAAAGLPRAVHGAPRRPRPARRRAGG